MRLLLDTNIILDGIFQKSSNGYQLFKLIKRGYIQAYITRNILFELQRKIRQIHEDYRFDALEYVNASLQTLPFIYLPLISTEIAEKIDIPGSIYDKSLVAGSIKTDIPICTKDIKDIGQAKKLGVTVYTPKEAVDAVERPNAGLTVDDIFISFYHRFNEGTFILEFTPLWNSNMPNGTQPIYHIEDVGFLFYDFQSKEFIYDLEGQFQVIVVEPNIEIDKTIFIHLSYKNDTGIHLNINGNHKFLEKTWEESRTGRPAVHIMSHKNSKGRLGCAIRWFHSYPNFMNKKNMELVGKKRVREFEDRISLDTIFKSLRQS